MKSEPKPVPVRGTDAPVPFFKLGDFVKIIFSQNYGPREAGERLWVEVREKIGSQFWGVLANQPLTLDLNHGDPVVFEGIHVLECMTQAAAEREAQKAKAACRQ